MSKIPLNKIFTGKRASNIFPNFEEFVHLQETRPSNNFAVCNRSVAELYPIRLYIYFNQILLKLIMFQTLGEYNRAGFNKKYFGQ